MSTMQSNTQIVCVCVFVYMYVCVCVCECSTCICVCVGSPTQQCKDDLPVPGSMESPYTQVWHDTMSKACWENPGGQTKDTTLWRRIRVRERGTERTVQTTSWLHWGTLFHCFVLRSQNLGQDLSVTSTQAQTWLCRLPGDSKRAETGERSVEEVLGVVVSPEHIPTNAAPFPASVPAHTSMASIAY